MTPEITSVALYHLSVRFVWFLTNDAIALLVRFHCFVERFYEIEVRVVTNLMKSREQCNQLLLDEDNFLKFVTERMLYSDVSLVKLVDMIENALSCNFHH